MAKEPAKSRALPPKINKRNARSYGPGMHKDVEQFEMGSFTGQRNEEVRKPERVRGGWKEVVRGLRGGVFAAFNVVEGDVEECGGAGDEEGWEGKECGGLKSFEPLVPKEDRPDDLFTGGSGIGPGFPMWLGESLLNPRNDLRLRLRLR